MSTFPKLTERRMTVYDASIPSSHSLSWQAASCHCQVDPAAARQARAIAITRIACRYASRGDSPAHGLLVQHRRRRPISGTGVRPQWLAPPPSRRCLALMADISATQGRGAHTCQRWPQRTGATQEEEFHTWHQACTSLPRYPFRVARCFPVAARSRHNRQAGFVARQTQLLGHGKRKMQHREIGAYKFYMN
jgi:hypothetical protein